jgi:predicted Rossmann fold nucleotide-binding protein DprA/Smf involved in DNA uptake
MEYATFCGENRELNASDLKALGYGEEMAQRILSLLHDTLPLQWYLRQGHRMGCVPLTRVSDMYPAMLRKQLGGESTGCLWAKGNLELLRFRRISLVGSRDLRPENCAFAREVGRQAAIQGFVLVSGNARGADREAQNACLAHGGGVISVVADDLAGKNPGEQELYLSEDSFDLPFTPQRALHRNHVIHGLGEMVFVAQSSLRTGGTWDGTAKNLRFGWSPVYCFADGSEAALALIQMGAEPVEIQQLGDLQGLPKAISLFDTEKDAFHS